MLTREDLFASCLRALWSSLAEEGHNLGHFIPHKNGQVGLLVDLGNGQGIDLVVGALIQTLISNLQCSCGSPVEAIVQLTADQPSTETNNPIWDFILRERETVSRLPVQITYRHRPSGSMAPVLVIKLG
jgi:hypothetical protein